MSIGVAPRTGYTHKNIHKHIYVYIYIYIYIHAYIYIALISNSFISNSFISNLSKIKKGRNWLEKKDLEILSTVPDTEFSGGTF